MRLKTIAKTFNLGVTTCERGYTLERLSKDKALELFINAPIERLQEDAITIRNKLNPSHQVTFTTNTNPNYTNICNIDCSFCAFYRHKGAKDTYEKSTQELLDIFDNASKAGILTVLLQGGVHEGITAEYLQSLVKLCRDNYPNLHPHFFTAVEIWNAANNSKISIRQALQMLYDAGQRTLPGGGAEILTEHVKQIVSPKKMGENGWIELHKTAHEIGFKSTATMMYGHVEEPKDIIEHLDKLRVLQDKTGGFYSFVPWSYKRVNTALRRTVRHWAGKDAYFRVLAISRIYLDNIQHIGASWFGEGKEIGIQSLGYGADDYGGTLMLENVHRAAKWINKSDQEEMINMILEAGYQPALRNEYYEIVQDYKQLQENVMPELQRRREQDSIYKEATETVFT